MQDLDQSEAPSEAHHVGRRKCREPTRGPHDSSTRVSSTTTEEEVGHGSEGAGGVVS